MRSQRVLCESCYQSLERPSAIVCLKCGEPKEGGEKTCWSCSERELFFSNFSYALVYAGSGQRLLEQGKFHARHRVIDFFSQYARQSFVHAAENKTVVLLPSSKRFLPDLIRGIKKHHKSLTVLENVFSRDHKMNATKTLSRHRRFQKLHNTLQIVNPPQISNSFLLCDDIYTTGATLNQAARLLHDAMGIERDKISAWTLFRTGRRFHGDAIV